MSQVYRLHLENLGIQTYRRLLSAASRTALSIRVIKGEGERRDKRVSLMESSDSGKKHKITNDERGRVKEGRPPPPPNFRCSIAKVNLILEQWIKDKVIQLPPVLREPTHEDRMNQRYCRYHRHIRHPTKDCWTLRRIFEEKYQLGELIFQEEEDDTTRVHVLMGEDDSLLQNGFVLEQEIEGVKSYTDATLLETAQSLTVTLAALTPMITSLQDTQREMKLTLEAINRYVESKKIPPKEKNETLTLLSTPHESNSYITKSELEAMFKNFVPPTVHGYDSNPSYTQEKTHDKEEERGTSQHGGRLVRAREVYPPNRSMGMNKRGPPEETYEVKQKRTKGNGDKKKKDIETPPPFRCSMNQVHLVLDEWIKNGVVNRPIPHKEPTYEDKANPRYCRYHRHLRHPTKDCWTLRKMFDNMHRSGKLTFPKDNAR